MLYIRKSITFVIIAIAMIGFSTNAFIASAEGDAVVATTTQSIQPTSPQAAGSTLEVHIGNDGKVAVRGAKVTAISGSSISTSATFGAMTMNWVVNTNSSTEFLRRYGGKTTIAEIQVGDFVSFSGMLDTTQSIPTVNAVTIKDWSIQMAHTSFSGTVASIDPNVMTFVLQNPNHANISVTVSSSTVIKRGDVTIGFADIKVADKITKTEGWYNNLTRILKAEKVEVYVNKALLNKRTFEGTLKSVSASTTLPTSFMLTLGSIDFTVDVPSGISILNKDWLQTPLSTFVVGDKVRVYGAVEANNTSVVDASVVRDASR